MRTYFILLFTVLAADVLGQQSATIAKGNDYYRQSRFDLAEAQYRKALSAEPSNANAIFNLANALQQQKRYEEAARILESLQTDDKNLKSIAWYNQGVAYTKAKNLPASIESYKKALRINPDDRQARENLQKALLEQKAQNQQNQQKKQDPKMSEKEAEQKLKLLQQKERQLRQRKQNKEQGNGQSQDW